MIVDANIFSDLELAAYRNGFEPLPNEATHDYVRRYLMSRARFDDTEQQLINRLYHLHRPE